MPKKETKLKKELQDLDRLMKGHKKLLIIVHNNPDPDAIAAAMGLKYLVKQKYDLASDIAYDGNVGRAENRAMVNKLKIKMKQINRISMEKYDRFALVDTQPGAGNNAFPSGKKCHLVIDHHPKLKSAEADLFIVEPEIGVNATILVEWLNACNIDINADLATALSYAISSETQNLGREADKRDIQAYLQVYVKSSVRKLAQIMHPKLPRPYFVALSETLNSTIIYKNLICSNLGDVPNAEIVAEMADFLLRHERMGWALCTGRFKDRLIISVRTTNPNAQAGKLVKALVNDPNTVGGHDKIAGGFIPLNSKGKKELADLEKKLLENFSRQTGNKGAEWKPLLNSAESPVPKK